MDYFRSLEDPPIDRSKRHQLLDIVAIATCAVICGANSWVYVEMLGRSKDEWFRTFLDLPNGIPSHDTFGDVFSRWDPEQFRSCKDADAALTDMITGIGEMSRGELAGERMTVAYEERSQEDEHSCFSDNTIADIVANAAGIQRVYMGQYGAVSGPGIKDLVAVEDPDLAMSLEAEINRSVALARAIPPPFDSQLVQGLADSEPGRKAILDTIVALENQTDTIVSAAQKVGITISVS